MAHDEANESNQRGLELFSSDIGAAVIELEEAARLAPARPDLWRHLGMALARAGCPEEAKRALERSAALRSDDPYVHALLARLHTTTGDRKAALAAWECALSITWRLSEAHEARARLLTAMQRFADAAAAWRVFIRMNPANAVAHVQLASCMARLGRVRGARNALAQAQKLDRDYFDTHPDDRRLMEELAPQPAHDERRGRARGDDEQRRAVRP